MGVPHGDTPTLSSADLECCQLRGPLGVYPGVEIVFNRVDYIFGGELQCTFESFIHISMEDD